MKGEDVVYFQEPVSIQTAIYRIISRLEKLESRLDEIEETLKKEQVVVKKNS